MLTEIIGIIETDCATCQLNTTFIVVEIQDASGLSYQATCTICDTVESIQRTPWSDIRQQLSRARQYGTVPFQPVDFLPLNIETNRLWISQSGAGYLDCVSCGRFVRHQIMTVGDLFKASNHLRCTACEFRKDFPARTWTEIATEQQAIIASY